MCMSASVMYVYECKCYVCVHMLYLCGSVYMLITSTMHLALHVYWRTQVCFWVYTCTLNHFSPLWGTMCGLIRQCVSNASLQFFSQYLHYPHMLGHKLSALFFQIVLMVSQIMWCRDLTECLQGDKESIAEKVKGAEQRCFDVSPWILKCLCVEVKK